MSKLNSHLLDSCIEYCRGLDFNVADGEAAVNAFVEIGLEIDRYLSI